MAKKETTKNTATIAAKTASKVAADILKANPDINEVYVTSDGTAFYTRNDAQNHANTLKNRELFSTKRGAAEAMEKKEAEKASEAPANKSAEGEETKENDQPENTEK